MSNQLQITGGAKVRSLEGVITGTSGVLSSLPINTSNGIPQLDVNGKILVSQLPNSVMEYKGTWNAATNTPTLADGTGNQGDVYLCNVAGTVNFGSGPIQFYVGDQVIYSGTIWQRASGASGTVTSVAVTESGDALTITGSPITTSGTINIGFAGSSAQYIAGNGSLVTFPSIITQAQNLVTEVYNKSGATLTKGTVVYINGGQGNLPSITKALATSDASSAQTYGVVQADITNMNNGYVVVAGRLQDIDTQAYTEGTQLYLSSTTAGAWTSTKQYAPAHLVYVGIVVRSHPTQGIVEIKIQNGYELDELHNVSAQTPSNNDGLFYNSSNSLWENKSISTALGYTPADDSLVVKLAGTQTITGSKTFSLATKQESGILLKNGTTTALSGYTGIGGGSLNNGIDIILNGSGFTQSLLFQTGAGYNYTFPATSGTMILGSGISGNVPFYTGTNTISSENGFMYDSSTNRFGVNTTVPNATIGANASIDSGYSLLLKNADANYNGLGFGLDSTYGNIITTQKIGTANARNFTLQNQSGYVSIDESGNFGVNILTPKGGVDIYNSTTAALYLHNSASGVAATDGVRLSLNSTNANLRNYEAGTLSMTSEGDFSIITAATENFRVNSADGSIYQSKVANAMLKSVSGVITAAVAGTDYLDPSSLSGYVPTSRTISINGTTQDLSSNRSWSVGTLTGGGAASRVAFWDGASNVVSDSLFVWDDTNNRLGIGLTNPQRALEIYSASADTHLRLSGSAPSVSMGEAITGSIYQAKFGLATANNQFVTGSVAGDFVINNQTGATIWAYNSTEKMRLDTNGNLGVGGIANSSYRLHVFGLAPMIGIESTGSGSSYLRYLQAGTVVASMYFNSSNNNLTISNNNGGVVFNTASTNSALTIASAGLSTFSRNDTGNISIVSSNSYINAGNLINFVHNSGGSTTNGYIGHGGDSTGNFVIINNGINALTFARSTGAATFSSSVTAGGEILINGNFAIGLNSNVSQSQQLQFRNSGTNKWQLYLDTSNDSFNIYNSTAGSNAFRILTSGNVGIGTTSPIFSGFAQLTVNGTQGGIAIQGSSTGYSRLFFAKDDTSNVEGLIRYYHSDNSMQFFTSATERMRITSSGNVLINTTSTTAASINTSGTLQVNSEIMSVGSSAGLFWTNRAGGVTSNSNWYGWYTSSGTIFLWNGSSNIAQINASSGAYTALSDKNKKKDFEDSTIGLNAILSLKPTLYRMINEDENVEKHLGFIAQEVKEFIPQAYVENDGFIGLNEMPIIAALVKSIQEQQAQIDELKLK